MAKIMCTNCRTVSDLPDEYLGRSVACKICQTVFTATAIDSGAGEPSTAINAGAAKPSQVKTVLGPATAVAAKPAPSETMLGSAAKTSVVARPSQIKTVLGPVPGDPLDREDAAAPPAAEAQDTSNGRGHNPERVRAKTIAPSVISLIFGCLSVVCLLLGFFAGAMGLGEIFGSTQWAAVPLALLGILVGFFGRGKMRVAGVVLNIIAIIPAVIIVGIFLIAVGGTAIDEAAKKADQEAQARAEQDARAKTQAEEYARRDKAKADELARKKAAEEADVKAEQERQQRDREAHAKVEAEQRKAKAKADEEAANLVVMKAKVLIKQNQRNRREEALAQLKNVIDEYPKTQAAGDAAEQLNLVAELLARDYLGDAKKLIDEGEDEEAMKCLKKIGRDLPPSQGAQEAAKLLAEMNKPRTTEEAKKHADEQARKRDVIKKRREDQAAKEQAERDAQAAKAAKDKADQEKEAANKRADQEAKAKAAREKETADREAKKKAAAKEVQEKLEKAAAGKLKLAKRLLDEDGNRDGAADSLRKIVAEFPNTKAADEARELLKKLDK